MCVKYFFLVKTLLFAVYPFDLIAASDTIFAVHRQSLAEVISLDGKVEAVNQSTVSSQVNARIIELPFDVNDYVEKAAVIIRFEDKEQRARVEQNNALLDEANSRYQESQKEYKRIALLYERKLVAKADFDRANANLAATKAKYEAAKAALTEAEEKLTQTVVRAPYSGIVTERHVALGELATVGQPLMTGLSLEALRVIVDVPFSLSHYFRQGDIFVVLADNAKLPITTKYFFPHVDTNTQTMRVRLSLPQGQHNLFPGIYVKVYFNGPMRSGIFIPNSAIIYRGEMTGVFALNQNNSPEFRFIKLGKKMDDKHEVLSGLSDGDKIVIQPN